jgi:hypothetical protein
MSTVIPDQELRERIAADTPRVPRSFYDNPVPIPLGWMRRRGQCFLQLSPAYDDDRARAEAYGWPTDRIDVAVTPDVVADALIDLIERSRR